MSKVHDILRGDREQPLKKHWYLKIHDGTIYGPVDLIVLCDWAGQSRLAPGNLISENRIEWYPAQELPDLKMEWQARLPSGETYGPFNVLAVPHLVQNGILPVESTLTNKLTGKTLHVKDILKPAQGSHPEQDTGPHHLPTDKTPSEQHSIDSGTPLLHEAEIQHTIDKMTYRPPEIPESIKSKSTKVQDRVERTKESPSRLNLDAEQSKLRIEIAEKELASQKREKEHVSKQAAAKEEQLKTKLEQAEKELKLTKEELASLRQKTGEDYKGAETTQKQAAKKEQELNRALEETRRKAETDAALLLKTRAQLDEIKDQKAEIQNRSSKEETRSRVHAQELEKQIQLLTAEIQNSKAQYQSLERDFQGKQEKLQVQISQFKEKADTALAELEKSKKELQSQKSLYVDVEKTGINKEAALTADVRNAKAALSKVDTELALLRKQHEILKNQSSHKETELQNRLDQIGNESRNQTITLDNLRKDLAAKNEECKEIEKRAKNFEAESEKTQNLLRQMQEERSVLESKNKRLSDDFTRYKIEAEAERNTLTEFKARHQEDKNQMSAKLEKLQFEKQTILEKLLESEKGISKQKQENDKLCNQLASMEREIRNKTDEISKQKSEIESGKKILANARNEHTEETLKLQARIDQLQSETNSNLEKLNDNARQLSLQKNENEKLQDKIDSSDKEHNDLIESLRDELAEAKQNQAEVRISHQALEKNLHAKEHELQHQLEEIRAASTVKTSQIDKIKRELADATATISKTQEEHIQRETRIRQELDEKESQALALEKTIKQLQKDITKQKDHYETILEGERQREEQLESSVAKVENKHQGSDARLNELNEKLSETENLVEQERERFEQEKSLLEENLTKYEREKSRAITLAESLEKKLKILEAEAASKETLLQENQKELAIEREWRKNVQTNIYMFEDKLQAETNLHADTNVQLAEVRHLLKEEQLRSEQQKNEFTERTKLFQEEKSQAIAASETMSEKLEKLESQIVSTESRLAETAKELEAERAKNLTISASSSDREADLQKTIGELKKQGEQHAGKADIHQRHIEEFKKEHSSLAEELRNKIKEVEENLSASKTHHEAAIKEEKERNKSLTRELQLAQEKMKELAPDAQSGTVSGNNPLFFEKRYSPSDKLAACIILAILSISMFVAGRYYGRSKLLSQGEQQAAVLPIVTNQAPVLLTKPKKPVPRITVERAITTYTETSCMIVFDYGLFSTRTNLTNDAIDTLSEVAAQLKDSMGEYKLIIEGHSDTMKTGSSTTPKDNFNLALARATRVKDIFKTKYNLPAESMEATSTGEESPPFQNTDDNMRKKNRTVVLKLLPK